MNYLKLFISLIIILNIAGCSTMRTSGQVVNISALTENKTYQLRVRSGNLALDRFIYDYASMRFGEYLHISGKGPFSGHVDIVFSDSSKKGLSGPTAGYTKNIIYGNSWYTGDDAPWSDNDYQAPGTELPRGGKLSWQDSATVLIITDDEGGNTWKAYYNYRGGSELSGLRVKTADEAARLSVDRIIEQFEKEFILFEKEVIPVPQAVSHKALNEDFDFYLTVEDAVPGQEDSAGEKAGPVSSAD